MQTPHYAAVNDTNPACLASTHNFIGDAVRSYVCLILLTFLSLCFPAGEGYAYGAPPDLQGATAFDAPPPNGRDVPKRSPYRIGVGDILQVDVWKDKTLAQEQAVRPDGKIAFKLVGDIPVEGMTIPDLRAQLTDKYRAYIPEAEISVVLKEINSFKVYVLGRIEKPGEYKASGELTMLQVLALAGPFTAYANEKEIKVFRRQNQTDIILTFNYRDVVKGLAGDIALWPNDRILIP